MEARNHHDDGYIQITGTKHDDEHRKELTTKSHKADVAYSKTCSNYHIHSVQQRGFIDMISVDYVNMVYALRREDLLNLKDIIDAMVEDDAYVEQASTVGKHMGF